MQCVLKTKDSLNTYILAHSFVGILSSRRHFNLSTYFLIFVTKRNPFVTWIIPCIHKFSGILYSQEEIVRQVSSLVRVIMIKFASLLFWMLCHVSYRSHSSRFFSVSNLMLRVGGCCSTYTFFARSLLSALKKETETYALFFFRSSRVQFSHVRRIIMVQFAASTVP